MSSGIEKLMELGKAYGWNVSDYEDRRTTESLDAMEMAEGCPFPNMAEGADPREWFSDLWEQINGAGSWDLNPWVWVIEFKRLETAS